MAYIKLEYDDYVVLHTMMNDVIDLTDDEKLIKTKIEGIMGLMEQKRRQELIKAPRVTNGDPRLRSHKPAVRRTYS